jgi:hypothetical protein
MRAGTCGVRRTLTTRKTVAHVPASPTLVQSSLEMSENRSAWHASSMSAGVRSMPLGFRPFHASAPERSSLYVPSSRRALRVVSSSIDGILPPPTAATS